MMQYWIYDLIIPGATYYERMGIISKRFKKYPSDRLVMVPTGHVAGPQAVEKIARGFIEEGFEGAMIRDLDSLYECDKRSNGLLKYKVFDEDEFRIVDVEEGRGRLQGSVGKFICEIKSGKKVKTFGVALGGTGVHSFLKEAWHNPKLWEGKWMRVQYFGFTKADGLPRIPTGKEIVDRD